MSKKIAAMHDSKLVMEIFGDAIINIPIIRVGFIKDVAKTPKHFGVPGRGATILDNDGRTHRPRDHRQRAHRRRQYIAAEPYTNESIPCRQNT